MRRTTVLVIPLALLLLAACGPGASTDPPPPPAPTIPPAPAQPAEEPQSKRPLAQRPPAAVRATLEANGVKVCEERQYEGSGAGDFATTVMNVAAGACPATGIVVVRQFNSGATQAKGIGFGDGLVYWTWDNLTISVTESTPPATVAAVKAALATEPNAPLRLDKRAT